MNELPELPEAQWWYESDDGSVINMKFELPTEAPLFTADQMRSYALSAVLMERERCAKLCDYHDKDCAATRREHDVTEVAAAIRSQTVVVSGLVCEGAQYNGTFAIRSPSKEG